MKCFSLCLRLTLCLALHYFSCQGRSTAGNVEKKNIYIVYTGAASRHGSAQDKHAQLLASVVQRKDHAEKRLVHVYSRGFSGCAVWLTESEAHQIGKRSDVVSVFRDPIYKLHTTRSWDFLQYDHVSHYAPKLNSAMLSDGVDTIIGILDTGIWPESESFNDKDMGPIPSRWKGVCMESSDFMASQCNRKLIGARYYNDTSDDEEPNDEDKTARDTVGHGTHTASTAAGSSVPGASYYGLAEGTAKGGSPGSRIAVYKVCSSTGCHGSSILAAFEDAIKDGVDVLSLSLGASVFLKPDFSTDPIAIGSFHAVEKGITVVCSAGNDGPTSATVVNGAPWILTVAATTIDRDFESDIVLGGNMVVKGEGLNFSNLKKLPIHPIIDGKSAKTSSGSAEDASNCLPYALDASKIKGKIVVCNHSGSSYSKREIKDGVQDSGGIGVILIDDLERYVASPSGDYPMTLVSSKEAAEILSYINSTKSPIATILPTVSVNNLKPAPMVAYFSSRGPSFQTKNLLKPDVAAPGVNILAAWINSNNTDNVPQGQKPSLFNLLSGTSMSCPHVSGIAAKIKSMNPSWSPSAIKSAIMTTASQMNNDKTPLTTDSGSAASPYDHGAGEVSPTAALQPGLVFETTTDDYLQFLCDYGYSVSKIKLITAVPGEFDCSNSSNADLISELNYPSIAVSKLAGNGSKSVSRAVTNVADDDEATYTVTISSSQGLNVKVMPEKLQFTKSIKQLTYIVTFSTTSATTKNYIFGSLTWTNGKYAVRTPFVVSSN